MARITPSSLVGSIRGKIGSVIYSSWKGLQYAKLMPVSIHNPMTSAQSLMRSGLITFLNMWRTLETPIKALWEDYAQGLGSQSIDNGQIGSVGIIPSPGAVMSGSNAFVGINQRLLQLGSPAVTMPPAYPVEGPSLFSASYSDGLITTVIKASGVALSPGDFARVFIRNDKAGGHSYLAKSRVIEQADINPVTGEISVSVEIDSLRVGHGGLIEEILLTALDNYPISLQADFVSAAGYKSPSSSVIKMLINPLFFSPENFLFWTVGLEFVSWKTYQSLHTAEIDNLTSIYGTTSADFKSDLKTLLKALWPLSSEERVVELFMHIIGNFASTDETINLAETDKMELEAAGIPTTVAGFITAEYAPFWEDYETLNKEW